MFRFRFGRTRRSQFHPGFVFSRNWNYVISGFDQSLLETPLRLHEWNRTRHTNAQIQQRIHTNTCDEDFCTGPPTNLSDRQGIRTYTRHSKQVHFPMSRTSNLMHSQKNHLPIARVINSPVAHRQHLRQRTNS